MANRGNPSPNPNLSRTPKSGFKSSLKKLPRASPHSTDFREYNENETDPRMSRSRSPVTKNFMSPTISAVSKRRVLSEMNRSSFSFDLPSESMESEVLDPGFHRWESPKIVSNPESFGDERECSTPAEVERESESKLPPYDPKVNYLSPRPKFLHYRPRPRPMLEFFDDGDEDLKSEGESVASQKSEDAEEKKEEVESLMDQKEIEEEMTEEPSAPRSSWRKKSLAAIFFILLIFGFGGFVFMNPGWSLSSELDLQKLPGKMKNWTFDFAVSLSDEDFSFFYSLYHESAINNPEEKPEITDVEEIDNDCDDYVEDEKITTEDFSILDVAGEMERQTESVTADLGNEERTIEEREIQTVASEVDEREIEGVHEGQAEQTNLSSLAEEEVPKAPREVEERETKTVLNSDERKTEIVLSPLSPATLLGGFSAFLAVAAIAIALRAKHGKSSPSPDHEEFQGNFSPEMSSSGRKEKARGGTIMGLRRDSITSCSPSYGSFTTYEKLSSKKVATLTPVRRSSRIRQKVSSPSSSDI